MNTAISNTGFGNYSIPASVATLSLKPIPRIDDPDGGIHRLRVPKPMDDLPVPAHLPEKRHQVLEVDHMVVSSSLIRRIEYELKHDECDPRTVFNSCRGLARSSLEFENSYIAARIRSFAKHQRIVTVPLLVTQSNADNPPQNPCQTTMKQKTTPPPPSHPLAVNNLGQLMSHLGLWVIAMLGTQVWAAWRLSAFANTYLEGGRNFHFAVVLSLILALDSAVWFRRRGRLFDAFLFPGAVLFLMALLPIFILHVRGILLAMN